ncbi:MAG TPA: ribonuclease E/G, partial [Pyrinomonadaceae bacterium]|nr:ribonuclease E/G [Pyrinomonadaceae bacterium]
MAKQLIVSVNGREKKIAIIEDDKVAEFYIERGEQHQGIVGNIYKGRVMRVLPGMQSAFVDIGLERDAFLYVSDFFDEEEEFERIVIDKSKKGAPDAEHAAAEEVALNRVEREQRIEAEQERAEPLLQEPEIAAVEEVPESQETGRRRGRRGRRRGRWEKGDEAPSTLPPSSPAFEVPDTPFVAGDPSIERIVDEEETAANGEMFKDARLQERIFDQIHAVEFNLEEDDFRSAEVGSLLSAGLGSESFERIDDGDADAEPIREAGRPREAHVSSFIDDVEADTLNRGGFQRISDDEEEGVAPVIAEEKPSGRRARKSAAAQGAEKKKRPSKAAASKSTTKKKASSKKSSKKRAANEEAENAESVAGYADSEARMGESQSRGEFATRRGGRRRRRPSKNKQQAAPESNGGNHVDSQADGQDDEREQPQFIEPEEIVVPPPAPEPTQRSRQRDQREKRDQRGYRGQSRRERHQPAITDLLSEGQEILVQIAKEPIAKKGARITSHIALPGRFLVYMPTVEHVGVSRKIESDNERHRLRKLIQTLRAEEDIPSGGFIVRTAGVGISEKELREDVRYLVRTWLDIRGAAEKSKAPALVHRDLDLVQRLLRDQLSDDFESIRVDSEEEYQGIVEFINRIQPRLVKRVKLYT